MLSYDFSPELMSCKLLAFLTAFYFILIYIIIAPPLDTPFIGDEFNVAFKNLKNNGFTRFTKVYVAYAEHDLGYVRRGAGRWIEEWKNFDDENLHFLGEEIKGFGHDSDAIPATINGYRFLYGKQR